MITLLKSIPFNILNKVSPTPQVGSIFSIPVIATRLTWQTIFTGVPTTVSAQIEVSTDGTNFFPLDISTNVAGDTRTINTSANFIRGRINSITIGSATDISILVNCRV